MADQPAPKLAAGKTRRDVDEPVWVLNLMSLRWSVLVAGALLATITDSFWWLAAALLGFFGIGQIVYRIYKKQDPGNAEIVFHNEVDGYSSCSDGDDGDGGD
ncbi:hypothetical protein RBY4I_3196 [Rhodobacterales bacterium Y4I]|nr:hypothetical protein RBY4I_3196 [Rhodobacterales bacterium Y4I]